MGENGSKGSMQYLWKSGKAPYMHAVWEFGMFPMYHQGRCLRSLFPWQVIFRLRMMIVQMNANAF